MDEVNKWGAAADNTPAGIVPPPVKATATVTVSSDYLQAEIYLSPPMNGGAHLTKEEIMQALKDHDVVFGIIPEMLDNLAEKPVYKKGFIIANGIPSVEDVPAELTYKIRVEKDVRPKENEDGTVDYKDLGIIQNVRAGDVLCVKTPAGPGAEGRTVLGIPIPPKPGRDIPLPMGKNTQMSGDHLQLLAACDGQADIVNQKIQVLNTYTVKGDVGNATGNIDFVGNIVVNGNVLTGFRIQATGNITVNGCVEGADVIAGGNIVLREGINGSGGRGMVQAAGYVKTKYIQNGVVQAGGDVETTFIQHSSVQSGANVNLVGNRATLAGGRVVARDAINAVYVGGKNSPVPTILEVGNDPATGNRYKELTKELETTKSQVASLLQAVATLEEIEKVGRLTEEKTEALQQARVVCTQLADRMGKLQNELADVQAELTTVGYGAINIKKSAYPGVRIIIGSEQVLLERQYDYCTFIRNAQGITFMPYS